MTMKNAERGFWCVVPAAGRGRRFGDDRPKQHVEIAGKSLLDWTLQRLSSHPLIVGIVVVIATDDVPSSAANILNGKPLFRVIGGVERADSVLAGLHGLPDCVADSEFILVHDAARPCVRHSDISALIERGKVSDGALLASPLRDTLKRADANGCVIETEPRESLWRALTPQMFRHGELIAALESARRDGVVVSDEAMAMERAGFKPLLVEGRDDNIKVTTPADRVLVEYLLGRDSIVGIRDS